MAFNIFKSLYLLLLVVLGPCSTQAFEPGDLEKMMTPEMMENMKNMMSGDVMENMKKMMTPEVMEGAKKMMENMKDNPSILNSMLGGAAAPKKKKEATKKGNLADLLQNYDPKTKTLKEEPESDEVDPLAAGLSHAQELLKNFDASHLKDSPFGDMMKNLDQSKLQEAMKNIDYSKLQEQMKNLDLSKAGEMLKQLGLSGDMFKGAEL
mmetsp:Transcript_119883/g.208133  ORF Transcript_119883/g.208133 Transcript_119883/m.208133 type:complete len:208 (+) Transcript_119883:118-741(+)